MNIWFIFLLLLLIGVFIIYLIVKMLGKHQLKKLRRKYNNEEDTSQRPEFNVRNKTYSRTLTRTAIPDRRKENTGEPVGDFERNKQFKRRGLFQNESAVSSREDKQKPGRVIHHKGIIGRLRGRRRT